MPQSSYTESGGRSRASSIFQEFWSEMESLFTKIDSIEDEIILQDPEWVSELHEDNSSKKWKTFKSVFKKTKSFDMNSGLSVDSQMIKSKDFVLDMNKPGGSPTFGEVQEPFESYVSELKPNKSIKEKYQLISGLSKKYHLSTPKFEDMGKGSLSLFWDHLRGKTH